VFAGAESRCGVEHDPDRPGGNTTAMVRPIDKESADPQGRERKLVFRQPVASRHLLLVDLDECTSGSNGC